MRCKYWSPVKLPRPDKHRERRSCLAVITDITILYTTGRVTKIVVCGSRTHDAPSVGCERFDEGQNIA